MRASASLAFPVMNIEITPKKTEGLERMIEVRVPVETVRDAEDKAARRYATLTFDEAIMRNLKVMDATALALCRDQNMQLKVFSIFVPGALSRVVMGEDEGTLVHC